MSQMVSINLRTKGSHFSCLDTLYRSVKCKKPTNTPFRYIGVPRIWVTAYGTECGDVFVLAHNFYGVAQYF